MAAEPHRSSHAAPGTQRSSSVTALPGVPPALASALAATAAVASLGAGAIHAATAKLNSVSGGLYITFFIVVAVAQIGWAALALMVPSRLTYAAGALGNLAVVVLWVVTRTAGPPVGPGAGIALPVGFPDALATAFEGVIVLAALPLAITRRAETGSLRIALVVAALAALVVVPLSVIAVLVQLGTLTFLPASP